jgi:hypothetical protein
MLWSALYALTINELPADSPTIASGNGCNHCHDPHKAGQDRKGNTIGFRLIRKSLLYAIENNGINPYDPGSPTTFDGDTALTMDEGIALCAQCHVEYVCGNSPIDKIDRDFFSWAKAADLEDVYSTNFPGYDGDYTTSDMKYIQDWIHGTGGLSSPNAPGNGVTYADPNPIQEELIKSQHPEAETYWNSRHYGNGAACFVCHMPKVTKISDGSTYTSHWIASPIKYMTPEPVEAFAARFGLEVDREGFISPCAECHGGKLSRRKEGAEAHQAVVYADALTVQAALVDSLAAIKAAKDGNGDTGLIAAAAEDHRAAHVRWENLVVSENSMGFHNPEEVGDELAVALSYAQSAKQKAEDALGACVITEDPEASCFDGLDNDCDTLTDCADTDDCEGADGGSTTCGVGECASTGSLTCSGGTAVDTCTKGTPTSEICTGGLDEDCDGLTDCDDTDCFDDQNCQVILPCYSYDDRTSCRDAGCKWDNKNDTCKNGDVCTITQDPEATCDDMTDNDCNGLTDCDDPACDTDPACQECTADEVGLCDDGIDNDCDGLTDCDDTVDCGTDPDCQQQVVCTDYLFDEEACLQAGCRFNKKKGCR